MILSYFGGILSCIDMDKIPFLLQGIHMDVLYVPDTLWNFHYNLLISGDDIGSAVILNSLF